MRLLSAFLILLSVPLYAADSDFTFVFMGDPHPTPPPYPSFQAAIDWVRLNKETWNIQGVFASGDFVRDPEQVRPKLADMWNIWGNSFRGIQPLGIPWIAAIGNHDYLGQFSLPPPCPGSCGVRDSDTFHTELGYGRQSALHNPWLETFWDFTEPPGVNKGDGKPNHAIRFNVGSHKFLVIALEHFPRNAALAWAGNLAARYPDHYVIYVTHSYQRTTGARSTDSDANYGTARIYTGSLLNDAASGEDIWNRLVKLHANSLMVLNGHWIQGGPYNPAHLHSGARHAYLGSQADAGQIVHQLFTNYQEEPNAGDGWFTLIRFKPSLGRIAVWQVKTFNCTANCTDTGSPGDSYEITYRPPRVAANQAPEVNAGTDQKVTLPGAALEGSVRDDGLPLGSVVTSAWTRASGPGQAIFTDPKVPKTMATFSAPGVYVLRLTASDTELSAYDEVEITVEQPGEHPRDQIRRRRR